MQNYFAHAILLDQSYTISEKENIKKSSVRIFCEFIYDLIDCEMV